MYQTRFVSFPDLFCEYRENHKKHDMHVLQYHDTYEIFLQSCGERYVFMNGSCYTLKPMDFFVVKPFEMHYCQSLNSDYYGRYVTNFDDNKLKLLLSSNEYNLLISKLSSGVYHLDESGYARMKNIFEELLRCCNRDGFLNEKLKYSLVLQLVLLVFEYRKSGQIHQTETYDVSPEILSAINYININYAKPLKLDYVTNQINMSKYYFCRQFKKATGMTFVEYVNSIRMSKVHQLLLDSSLSLAEIAKQTGFASGIHLTRVFRSHYQCTPSEFRKQNANRK